jgi:hypothetical protein
VKPQNENSENLNQNAQAAAADRDFMPVRPAATFAKAIDASADSAKQAATKGIKESGAYVSRQFGSTSSFVSTSIHLSDINASFVSHLDRLMRAHDRPVEQVYSPEASFLRERRF